MTTYVTSSLELHIFFARIMKEHAFFLEIGFTKAEPKCAHEAKRFKEEFEALLCRVVECSYGIVGENVLKSGEIVTEYTLHSEMKTSQLTGATLDLDITELENCLVHRSQKEYSSINESLVNKVKQINQRALELLENFIAFKKWVLDHVLRCNIYTVNYPLLIEHIIREAELYQRYVADLECGGGKNKDTLQNVELFWNQIMMEHALFIRGLLDPTETELIDTADKFAKEYAMLLNETRKMSQRTIIPVTKATMNETMKYRDFKATGTKGINECEIRSLIVPLLADHVLREANHYLRLLSQY